MQRPRFLTLSCLTAPMMLAVLVLGGCGNQITQIEGLPQTRDVADTPWPMLVDTPAPPTNALLPETGARTLMTLENAQGNALSRQAQPGPAPVERASLQGRVERIRQQTSTARASVDSADLSNRAARLTAMREQPSTGVPVEELRARGERLAATRAATPYYVDAAALQARGQRVTAMGGQRYGSVDSVDLQARAARLRQQTQNVVAPQSQTSPFDVVQITEQGTIVEAVTEPTPKPAVPRKPRSAPVVSTDFRKRAQEAVARARKRATAPPPE